MYSTCLSFHIVLKLDFFRQVFEKYSDIKFQVILFSGSPVFPYGRTNRREKANSHFSQKLRTA